MASQPQNTKNANQTCDIVTKKIKKKCAVKLKQPTEDEGQSEGSCAKQRKLKVKNSVQIASSRLEQRAGVSDLSDTEEFIRVENQKALTALDQVLKQSDDNGEFSDEDLAEEPKKRKAARVEEKRNRKVFIGGLPWKAVAEQVQEHFEKCGDIDSFNMPINKGTGKPMGIAFITFSNRSSVDIALRYHGKNYGGQKLRVKEADPDHGRGGQGESGTRNDRVGKASRKGDGKSDWGNR